MKTGTFCCTAQKALEKFLWWAIFFSTCNSEYFSTEGKDSGESKCGCIVFNTPDIHSMYFKGMII